MTLLQAAGPKLLLCLLLSMAAFAADSPALLLGLTLAEGGLLLATGASRRLLYQGLRLLLMQTLIIGGLHLMRYGQQGILPSLLISWRLLLALLPGLIFSHTTPQARVSAALHRWLPPRFAFVLTVCIGFMPLLLNQLREIRQTQILRGARLLPQDLWWPGNWPEWVHCLLVPAVIRSLCLAEEIAQAAAARGFNPHTRTCWPGG
jgi:energy-coupling factor transport system permease protein